jgi:hypothetical protein
MSKFESGIDGYHVTITEKVTTRVFVAGRRSDELNGAKDGAQAKARALALKAGAESYQALGATLTGRKQDITTITVCEGTC